MKFRKEIEQIKPYIPGKPIEEVEEELGITNIIKLASNENPLGPSPLAKEALGDVISRISFYPDGSCSLLKRRIGEILAISTDQVIVGNGSDEVIKMIAESMLSPGDQVIVADPTFSEYEFAALLMGAEVVKVPLVGFRHDLDSMVKAITERTKIIFVCNPNNPTGTIVRHRALVDFLDQVPEEILVVIDEAYNEYVEDPEYPRSIELLSTRGNLMVLRTFSKIYGLAGLRVGYGLSSQSIISWLSRVREPFNVNLPAQAAAYAALADEQHVQMSRQLNREGKTYLYQAFDNIKLAYVPTEANFILINVAQDCQRVFRALLTKGVIVRSADIFGLPTYLRVTIGTQEQNHRLIAALKEVLAGEDRH